MSWCDINSQQPLSCPGAPTASRGRKLAQVLGAAGLLALATATPGTIARAASTEPWITTWAATPAPRWAEELPVPFGVPEVLGNQTVRQVVRISVGGDRVGGDQLRVMISN